MSRKIQSFITIIVGVLLIIGLKTFASVCPVAEGEMPMKCLWTSRALLGLGGVIIGLGIMKFVYNCASSHIGFNISEVLLGIYGLSLIYFLIGTCKVDEMRCNVYTKPILTVVFILYLIFSVLFWNWNRKEASCS